MGAKQNRIVNASFLIAGNSEVVIPVSCVEQGRWAYRSAMFSYGEKVMPPSLRREKQKKVAESLNWGPDTVPIRARSGTTWLPNNKDVHPPQDRSHGRSSRRSKRPAGGLAEGLSSGGFPGRGPLWYQWESPGDGVLRTLADLQQVFQETDPELCPGCDWHA